MTFVNRAWSAAASRAVLYCASLLAPASRRAEFLAEWQAELWVLLRRAENKSCSSAPRPISPLAFCLGAFQDACWFRRNDRAEIGQPWLKSPVACVALLSVLVIANGVVLLRLPALQPAGGFAASFPQHALLIVCALVLLPLTTRLSLAEMPAAVRHPGGRTALRGWAFLALKLALSLALVFCGSFTLASILAAGAPRAVLQGHGVLVGYVFVLRWVLLDQQRRCPVCLKRLTHPTSIGNFSRSFLEWSGTEFLCGQGHGLLYVPEFETSYGRTQRWVHLDPSWASLFRPSHKIGHESGGAA